MDKKEPGPSLDASWDLVGQFIHEVSTPIRVATVETRRLLESLRKPDL